MATLNHSSLQAWLNFDAVNLPPIPSCQYANFTDPSRNATEPLDIPVLTNASCAQVCNDTASLFALQSDNLVTCGLFTSIVSAFTYLGPNNTLVPNNDSHLDHLTSPAPWKELISNEAQYAPLYADVIGDCLEVVYYNIKEYSFSDDGHVAAACTRDQLFPFGSNSNDTHTTTSALGDCLNEICSPLTLNPDLAGVGVSLDRMPRRPCIATQTAAGLLIFHHTVEHCYPCSYRFARSGAFVETLSESVSQNTFRKFSRSLGRLS